VIIDTDGGDDAIAILLALNCPDELVVEAITTVAGNVPMKQATSNVLRVLALNERVNSKHAEGTIDGEIRTSFKSYYPPVFGGAERPLLKPLKTAVEVHGHDGLGGVTFESTDLYPLPTHVSARTEHAVDAILEIVQKYPKEVTIITLGPLTNIALAIQKNKEAFQLTKEIIVMGGAFETYGNVTLSAEYNIFVDPDSVALTLSASVPVIFVPLDVTMKVEFDDETLDPHLPISTTTATFSQFIHDITRTVRHFKKGTKPPGARDIIMHMHDPLCVAVAMNQLKWQIVPDHSMKHAHVVVETEGLHTNGKTIADLRWNTQVATQKGTDNSNSSTESVHANLIVQSANAKVCVGVSSENFYKLFVERVLKK